MYNFPWILVQLMLAWVLGAAVLASAASAETSSGCPDSCGDIKIPYPFGTKKECYMEDHFLVTCDHSSNPHKLYLGGNESTIEVTEILLSGEFRILSRIAHDCYNKQGVLEANNDPSVSLSKFPLSNARNKFTAVGCDTYAVIEGFHQGQYYTSGCLSLCDSIFDKVINGSCTGIGCCEKSIPKGITSFHFNVSSRKNHAGVWDFNPCSYAFVAEETNYTFSSVDLANLQNRSVFPVVLDWAVGNQTCDKSRKNLTSFACKDNSYCYDVDNGPGYRCNCSKGYDGNPYLSNGCADINECIISSPCNMTCDNLPGTYNCSCPEGYEGDGRTDGTGCSPIPVSNNSLPLIKIVLGISISILVLLLGGSWLFWGFRQRNIINLREKFFRQNGGIMLQQQLSKREGSVQSAKIFSVEDLKKATNNYHESRVLGRGGQGTVYKGVLPDTTIVAIKKSKVADQSQTQIEQFINEVVILSQVNHRNVVKLLGCCLETQVPLLVYEFITNGTLYDYIHRIGHNASSITWKTRLRIATETATALSYLHSAANTPIIHRDVKSTNILLDENYTAKVSDFGASKLIPTEQTQLTTLVQGTLGYLDPEYFQTSQLTEKSDVYSFGVVLVELLTSKDAISFSRPEAERNLAMYFISAMKEDRLFEIVDEQLMNDAQPGQLIEFAILAKRCLPVKGDERPTMKEVAMELEGLRMTDKHTWINDNKVSEETQYLLGDQLSNAYGGGGTSMSNSTACDSIANHVMSPFGSGR